MFSDVGVTPVTAATTAEIGAAPGPDVLAGGGGVAVLTAPVVTEDAALELDDRVAVSAWVITGLLICVGATLVFGIWPAPLFNFAHDATLIF